MKIEKLLTKLIHENPEERINALRALGKFKDVDSLSLILKLADSEVDEKVRTQIAICLGEYANVNAGESLLKLANDEEITVKMEAVTALGILGSRGFTKAKEKLEDLISEKNFAVKKYSIKALGKCGDSGSIEKLNNLFNEEESSVEIKSWIAQAIGEIGGSRAMELLNDWALKGIMEVRREAIKALGTIADEIAVDLLVHIMNEGRENKIIRNHAKAALINIINVAKERYNSLRKRIENYI